MMKQVLFGKTLDELKAVCAELKLPGFTAKQIAQWLYQKQISSIDEMTNISQKNRALIAELYELGLSAPVNEQESVDGTKKYLYKSGEKHFIESAYIPDKDRATLCISSQVGCKMGCLFCMTGKQGFQAHLSPGEIINQIHSLPEKEKLTNVVYMGMGEPFDNIDNVLKSLQILTSDWGYAWSPRRITVSTIGLIPPMKKFLDESECHLAISLHTPFEKERKQLMPVENVYRLPDVIKTVREFDFGRQRRISFEYIMFKGVNDSLQHAKELLRLLNGMRTRINLIRFHPIPDTPLEGTSPDGMRDFANYLNDRGITTTIRASRGEDIFAACGLLSTKELIKKQKGEH